MIPSLPTNTALAVLLIGGWLLYSTAASAADGPHEVGVGIHYELMDRWQVDKLNEILIKKTPAFTGFDVEYTPATNAVLLYRVTYQTVVPLLDNQPQTVTGLVAVPDGMTGPLPLLSYQHGSEYLKTSVPSDPENSPETQLIIAQFAGQGYSVVAADYIGLGGSEAPQSYLVKSSHQQSTTDMLRAARPVLADLDRPAALLFIGGWSQGGYVTMAMLERLEQDGIPVAAAATASAPLDLYAAISGFLHFPRKIDAPWLNTLLAMNAFALEEYHRLPGFAASFLTPEGYKAGRKLYQGDPDFDLKELPTDLTKLIQEDYFDPAYFNQSRYGKLLDKSAVYRWIIQTPVRNYYGESDQAITVGVGRMAQAWQRAMGAGNDKVEAISMGSDATHRGTFARAVPEWKKWFDSLAEQADQ